MQPSGWSTRFSVSIKALDIQHQRIVEILDQLTTLIIQKGEVGLTDPLLDDLLNKIKEHFEFEEALMKNNLYPSFPLHKTMHDAFLRQFSNRHKNWKEGTESLSIEGVSFLKRWFIDHILGADKLYTPFLNHRGIS